MISKESLFRLARALEGLPVLGCLSGTPAALAGVRYGDVLLSVNGMRTRSLSDYVLAKDLRADGMEIVVFRSGTEQTLAFLYNRRRTPPDMMSVFAELVTMRVDGAPEAHDEEPS